MKEKKRKEIDNNELSAFCAQTALILEAGLPLFDGLETLAQTNSESPCADLYRAAADIVTAGGSLSEALGSDARWPAYMREMVEVGERTGRLEHVLKGLEAYYAREERIRLSIRSALTYPLTLGFMLALIVLIMLWKVLPVFNDVLSSMGMSGEGTGGFMLRIGTAVGWTALILVGLALAAVLASVLLMRTKYAGRVRELIAGVFPGVKRLEGALGASRVAGVLSMMLSGGFTAREALERTQDVIKDSPQTRGRVERIMKQMDEGASFADAVEESELFNPMHNRMIRMGAATAREDRVFDRIAGIYEEQAENDISAMVSIIEPTLVGLLTIVIGAVLLSVMLPMAGMLASM